MTPSDVTPPKWAGYKVTWQSLIEFTLSKESGSERLAVDRVAGAVHRLNLPAAYLEQLKLALSGAILNAIGQGRRHGLEAPPVIRVLVQEKDRAAQPAGQPPARGWSFFVVEKTVPSPDYRAEQPLIELFLYPGGKP
jgi:hypothetical protein